MKTHSEITKVDFNRYVTPVSNLEVGDIINWIGIYDAGKEVYFDTITLLKYDRPIAFKIVDIDYNPNKPDDIIFEFDKVLVPTNSKVITINKDRFAGTNIKNTKSNGKSLFDIEQEMYRIQWLMNAEKFGLQENNKGE
jgi:hypothetical protein